MAKNKKSVVETQPALDQRRIPTASYREMPMTGPVPVRPVAQNVQLTPIVQPISFVPYSSQKQPLYMMDDEYIEDTQNIEEQAQEYAEVKKKKAVGYASIFLIILSILLIAVYFLAKISAIAEYTAILSEGDKFFSGYELIESFIKGLDFSNFDINYLAETNSLIAIMLLSGGLFAVLTLIASFFRLRKKGTSVFVKITAFLLLACILAALIIALVKSLEIAIGLYIITGLAVLIAIIAFVARKEKRVI